MPATTSEGVSLSYETAGEGETIALLGEAGVGPWQWGWQFEALAGPYEVLLPEFRGTGRSDRPAAGYDVETLTNDVEAVLADTGSRRAHLVGVGFGGMVALRYAGRYDRARSLTLVGTTADGSDVDLEAFLEFHSSAETGDPTVEACLSTAFSPEFLNRQGELMEDIESWRAEEDADVDVVRQYADAMVGFEAGSLYELTLPTLVFHGVDDPIVPVAAGRRLAEELPQSTFEAVEGRHFAHVEHSRAVNDRLLGFLDDVTGD